MGSADLRAPLLAAPQPEAPLPEAPPARSRVAPPRRVLQGPPQLAPVQPASSQRASRPWRTALERLQILLGYTGLFVLAPFALPLGIENAVAQSLMTISAVLLVLASSRLLKRLAASEIIMLMIIVVGCGIAWYANPAFSGWQAFRSGLGMPICVLALAAAQGMDEDVRRKFTSVANWAPWIMLGQYAAFLFTEVAPNIVIMVESDVSGWRVFLAPFVAMAALMAFHLQRGNYVRAAVCIGLLLASGSKGVAIAVAAAAVTAALFPGRRRTLTNLAGSTLLIGFTLVALYLAVGDRFAVWSLEYDHLRVREITEAMEAVTSNFTSLAFGVPYGVPYTEGYYAYLRGDPGDAFRMIENSRFDVHNGFVYLLFRHGLIGVTALLFFVRRFIRETAGGVVFLAYVCGTLLSSASSLQTPDGAFGMLLFALLASRPPDATQRR